MKFKKNQNPNPENSNLSMNNFKDFFLKKKRTTKT